jgi:hypothetical protein
VTSLHFLSRECDTGSMPGSCTSKSPPFLQTVPAQTSSYGTAVVGQKHGETTGKPSVPDQSSAFDIPLWRMSAVSRVRLSEEQEMTSRTVCSSASARPLSGVWFPSRNADNARLAHLRLTSSWHVGNGDRLIDGMTRSADVILRGQLPERIRWRGAASLIRPEPFAVTAIATVHAIYSGGGKHPARRGARFGRLPLRLASVVAHSLFAAVGAAL